jgi:hypothetical protein
LDLTRVVAIAAASPSGTSLALRSDGTVTTFMVPGWADGSTNIVAVAAGLMDVYLILRADGTFGSWYEDKYKADPGRPPQGLTNVVAISTRGGPADGLALIGDGPPALNLPVSNPVYASGTFSVSVPTRNGHVYSLESNDSLANANWRLLPLVAGDGRARALTDSAATGPQRFYRVRQW